jgi:cobalt/nickel transport system permease protein
MAIIGTIFSYYFYRVLRQALLKKNMLVSVFIAAWFSVVLAASFCAMELSLSGTSPLKIVLPAMLFVHVFIGLGEAIITTLVLSFIMKVRPDLICER